MIVNSISQAADPVKIELIRCTAPRYVMSAAPLLVYELENKNEKVRIAAIKALKEIGSPEQLDPLITYHMNTQSEKEMKDLEGTIVAICKRLPENQSQAAPLLKNYDKIKDAPTKASYLEMMGKIGDSKSLNILTSALEDKNDDIKTSAIRGLSEWPDMKPADELLKIAKTSTNQIHQTLALRGYLNLLRQKRDLKPADKLNRYKEAMDLSGGVTEQKQILSGVARIRTPEAFEFAAKYLDDPSLKNEAEMAVLRISWRLGRDHIDLTLPMVKKVRAQTDNEEIKEQIDEMLEEIERDQE
jgi:HEAT repeat protein